MTNLEEIRAGLPDNVTVTDSDSYAAYDVKVAGALVYRVPYEFVVERRVHEVLALIRSKIT